MMNTDLGLERLLDFDGLFVEIGGGFWIKIAARRVPADAARPHGIAYSLTLHDSGGERIFGIDNAHAVRVSRGPAARRQASRDHLHRNGTVRPYRYIDADTLVSDFLQEVEAILRQKGVR